MKSQEVEDEEKSDDTLPGKLAGSIHTFSYCQLTYAADLSGCLVNTAFLIY